MHVFFQILHLQRPSTKLTIFTRCRFALITHRLRKFTLELFRQDFRFYPNHFRRGNLGWRARRKRGKLRNIEYCAFSVFSSLFLHYYFHYPNVRSSRGSKTRKDVSLFSVCGLLPANFFHSNIWSKNSTSNFRLDWAKKQNFGFAVLCFISVHDACKHFCGPRLHRTSN